LRAENTCDASLAIAPDSVSILSMQWKGKIEGPMAACIMTAFAKVQSTPTVWRVSLALNSPGGDLRAAEEVVAALKHIRKTHQLSTIVWQGATCSSACVLVFLAGERRYGALSSIWLFHEVGQWTPEKNHPLTTNRTATERLFQDYFLAAGVSEAWLSKLRPLIQHADYWQTGPELIGRQERDHYAPD
jgi:ATP-dependent protease ClpP protease subunit